jgi:hypothetical protein
VIIEAAKDVLGLEERREEKEWYNNECKAAIKQRARARVSMLNRHISFCLVINNQNVINISGVENQ